mmetsp:Transcript_22491/g.55457  ORF Transcript_22491/g.55457 Transcript_22491/m.55457 type:complete len:204 (+) Transcript_22491:39-650(+)
MLAEAGTGTLLACGAVVLLALLLLLSALGRHRGPLKTIVVLGSGGHTSEMLSLLSALPHARFPEMVFMVAATDTNTLGRLLRQFPRARVIRTPRAREVGQSWVSTVGTTFVALLHAVWTVLKERPDCVMCNGPGTCVPVAYAAVLMRVILLRRCKIAFVESIARVHGLSLSGKLLYPVADRFLVQWEDLVQKYPRAKYVGFVI